MISALVLNDRADQCHDTRRVLIVDTVAGLA